MVNTQQRILMTGITSIHGWPVWNALCKNVPHNQLLGIRPPKTKVPKAENVIPLCITDIDHLKHICETFQPTIVIHCAGVCDLDVCEDRPEWAYDINVNGMKAVTRVFGDSCKIIYMSTDLVFSGDTPPENGYAEHHRPDPVSIAGKTFYQAEQVLREFDNTAILRLGLPLGDSVTGTKGAIDWIKGRLLKHRPVTLFYDELRSCLWCDQIAQITPALLSLNLRGLYHFGGNRTWTLHEIGQYVRDNHNIPHFLLKGIYRHEEQNGPPRIGNVSMNSIKLKTELNQAGISITHFNQTYDLCD